MVKDMIIYSVTKLTLEPAEKPALKVELKNLSLNEGDSSAPCGSGTAEAVYRANSRP